MARGPAPAAAMVLMGTALAVLAQDDAQQAREAALAQDPAPEAIRALSRHPELFEDRDIQRGLFRALRSSDEKLVRAVFELCFQSEALLLASPIIRRRFENSFLGPNPDRKRLLLEVAEQSPALLEDLRVVSLLSEALVDDDPGLSAKSQEIIEARPGLVRKPALAEALARKGSTEPGLPLPNFQQFSDRLLPILQKPGGDAMACYDCHKSRIILRLPEPAESTDNEELKQIYYRSLLRVIDLERPQESLLLHKPTKPEPADPRSPSSPDTHPGGERFAPGSDVQQTLLDWIRSGMPIAN